MNLNKLFQNPHYYFSKLILRLKRRYWAYTDQKKLAASLYAEVMGKGKVIDWANPKSLNEKINWLKFNSDTSQWSVLADKYCVRQYVENKIGAQYLVPLLGVWDNVNDIEFSKLPNSFVLKSNNGAGTVMIIKDKDLIDEDEVRKTLRKWLKLKFGLMQAEPHYRRIKPLIIAESVLKESNPITSSLIDYKIWCFNGKIFGTWVCYNRKGMSADTEWHDLDWRFRPEWSVFTDHYRNGKGVIPKPESYNEMLQVASKLSTGFPQVRIDLYNIDGKIYFGEMTFTSAGGHNNFYSDEALNIMGDLTVLPE